MAVQIRRSDGAKKHIQRILRQQGYAPYARLLELFNVFLTDDPSVIAYMEPGKARIVLNEGLNTDQVSVIVRHEILHEYFNHAKRRLDWEEKHSKKGTHQLANIAMDFDISNKGYTEADKSTARDIILGDKTLRGLVTEDQYPDWENLTFEEMYEKLIDEYEEYKEKLQPLIDLMSRLNPPDMEELEDMDQQVSDIESRNAEDSSTQDSSNSKPSDSDDTQQQDSKGNSEVDIHKELEKDAANLDKEIQDAKQKAKEQAQQQDPNSDKVFDTPQQQKAKQDLSAQVKAIEDAFNDIALRDEIIYSTQDAISREHIAKQAKETERRNASPLQKFKLNLNTFIRNEISEHEEDTYQRMNPRYEDSDFLVPGTDVIEDKQIPLINVYHDVSYSFNDSAKTEMALRAIDTLNTYVRDGDIKIKLYYFADRVSDTRNGAGQGTEGTPVLQHIKQTQPRNVIIITDGDITDCSETVVVPGAVWMLFYGSRSNNLMQHLVGKKANKYYDINW